MSIYITYVCKYISTPSDCSTNEAECHVTHTYAYIITCVQVKEITAVLTNILLQIHTYRHMSMYIFTYIHKMQIECLRVIAHMRQTFFPFFVFVSIYMRLCIRSPYIQKHSALFTVIFFQSFYINFAVFCPFVAYLLVSKLYYNS